MTLAIAGAVVSFGAVVERAVETFPARSVDVAAIVTVPSGRIDASMFETVTEPAPPVAAVFETVWPPELRVTVTVSLASEPAGRETETLTVAAVPPLIQPAPFVSETAVGWAGGVASAVAVAVGLSRLQSGKASVETAWILYVYVVPSTVDGTVSS